MTMDFSKAAGLPLEPSATCAVHTRRITLCARIERLRRVKGPLAGVAMLDELPRCPTLAAKDGLRLTGPGAENDTAAEPSI